MDTVKFVGISLALVLPFCLCQQQYYQQNAAEAQYQPQQYENYNKPPPPQILTHKQALNHDGNFKYLFTSENGLAQGESIAPDGSRTGGYSYVDPTGKKISIKYTAGKEGFRILEGDHLPKAPLPVAPVPGVPGYQQPQAAYSAPYPSKQHDDGSYKPHLYEKPQQYFVQPAAAYTQPKAYQRPAPALTNAIVDREPEYNDEPGKPHSFGNGYIFEFAG